jgi:hypothetical protein
MYSLNWFISVDIFLRLRSKTTPRFGSLRCFLHQASNLLQLGPLEETDLSPRTATEILLTMSLSLSLSPPITLLSVSFSIYLSSTNILFVIVLPDFLLLYVCQVQILLSLLCLSSAVSISRLDTDVPLSILFSNALMYYYKPRRSNLWEVLFIFVFTISPYVNKCHGTLGSISHVHVVWMTMIRLLSNNTARLVTVPINFCK